MLERDWPIQVESHSEGKGCWRGTDPFRLKATTRGRGAGEGLARSG